MFSFECVLNMWIGVSDLPSKGIKEIYYKNNSVKSWKSHLNEKQKWNLLNIFQYQGALCDALCTYINMSVACIIVVTFLTFSYSVVMHDAYNWFS